MKKVLLILALGTFTLSNAQVFSGKGDKKLVYRTEIVKKYPKYPIFEGESFVPLGSLYLQIDKDYELLCLNEVLCIVEDLEDGSVYTPTIYKYLGFKEGKQVLKLKRQSGSDYCGVVAWSNAHAVFVCEDFMDYYGNKKSLWDKYPGRFRILKA